MTDSQYLQATVLVSIALLIGSAAVWSRLLF